MVIDFSQKILDLSGAEIPVPEGNGPEMKTKPLTLGTVAVNALMVALEGDNPSGEEKVKRWKLAQRIHGATEATLTAEDVAHLKQMIGKAYGALVVGRAFDLLESPPAQ